MTFDDAAVALTARIEALAAALHAAGVPADRSADVVSAATTAAMRALARQVEPDEPRGHAASPSRLAA